MEVTQSKKLLLKQGEMLCTTTIRVECSDANGNVSVGTGFYYSIETGDNYIPMVITNKHVVENMQVINLVLTKADAFGNRISEYCRFSSDKLDLLLINHPNDSVDLCAISLFPVVQELRESGIEIHTYFLNNAIIPSSADLAKIDSIEEILMIGYPSGLWDETNNMPLVRRGITATSAKLNFNGKEEFLIDAACYPGSSGSPIFYLDKTHKTDIANGVLGHKAYLLGILFSGPTQKIKGRVEIPDVEVDVVSNVMINLGHVLKASRLLELESEIKKIMT